MPTQTKSQAIRERGLLPEVGRQKLGVQAATQPSRRLGSERSMVSWPLRWPLAGDLQLGKQSQPTNIPVSHDGAIDTLSNAPSGRIRDLNVIFRKAAACTSVRAQSRLPTTFSVPMDECAQEFVFSSRRNPVFIYKRRVSQTSVANHFRHLFPVGSAPPRLVFIA